MSKKLLLSCLTLLISACGSKDSKPKDYWTLSEPQIYVWDTSINAKMTGFSKTVSEFNAKDIEENLDYESYVEFNNLDSDVRFNITTTCVSNEKSNSTTKTSQFAIDINKKLYLYNQLPENLFFEDQYVNKSLGHKCNFAF